MSFAQAEETGEAGRIRQRQVEQREIDPLLGRQDVQRVLDRHRLQDAGLGQGQPHGIAQRFAKQRMIVDDQEAGHGAFQRIHRASGSSATLLDRSGAGKMQGG